jgi:hypothetical protein
MWCAEYSQISYSDFTFVVGSTGFDSPRLNAGGSAMVFFLFDFGGSEHHTLELVSAVLGTGTDSTVNRTSCAEHSQSFNSKVLRFAGSTGFSSPRPNEEWMAYFFRLRCLASAHIPNTVAASDHP